MLVVKPVYFKYMEEFTTSYLKRKAATDSMTIQLESDCYADICPKLKAFLHHMCMCTYVYTSLLNGLIIIINTEQKSPEESLCIV